MPAITSRGSLGLEEDTDEQHPYRFLELPGGELLAYGGDNGNVSLWKGDKFKIVHRYDDAVRCMAISKDGKRLALGFDTGKTQIFVFDEYEAGTTTVHPYAQPKFTSSDDFLLSQDIGADDKDAYFAGPDLGAPARDMVFVPKTKDGYEKGECLLAMASEAGMFMVDVASKEILDSSPRLLEQESKEAHDHSGIRGLAYAIGGAQGIVVSLGMDGRLCQWSWDGVGKPFMLREEKRCVPKKDLGEIHGADAFDRACRPKYHQCSVGSPILGKPGKLIPRFDGYSTFHGADQGHVEPIVTMVTSSGGHVGRPVMVISAGRDARIVVWMNDKSINADSFEFVAKLQLESPPTDLLLREGLENGKASLFAACADGSFQMIDVSEHFQNFRGGSQQSLANETNKETVVAPKILKKSSFGEEEDDEDDSVEFSAFKSRSVHFLDEAEEDNGDDVDETKSSVAPGGVIDDEDEDGDGDDDDVSLEEMHPLPVMPNNALVVKPQAAFSPSSTPLDLTRRYLCWNHMGSVTLLQGENNRNTIDIHFADSAFKRPISFTDNMNFIIGSIGESGGIFASDTKEDDDEYDQEDDLEGFQMSERTKQAVRQDRKNRTGGNSKPTGSSIFFYRFETSNLINRRNKDWHLILPDGERVLGAACGDGWAAAMTSRKFLRFFSPGGNQDHMVWLKGEPVTMVGRGRFLAVFHHESSPLMDKTQQLGYTLWDAVEFRIVSRGSISCLSKGSSLSWVGFSNDFALVVMDTDGMASMLITTGRETNTINENLVWEWAPVLDTVGLRKSADDRHWPITMHDGKLVCIPLKGGNTYPDATRRPVTSTLGLRMPLAKSVLSKNSALEELSVRSNIALSQKKFVNEISYDAEEADELEDEYMALCAQVDKVTLRLFSGLIDAGKLEGASDLVGRLHSEKSYDIAIRIADRQYKLADEIEKAKIAKFSEGDVDDGYDEEEGSAAGTNSFRATSSNDSIRSKQISPDSDRAHKRSFERPRLVGTENKRQRFD